jgi:protein involved in polysaccharide export with SLBB domain
MVLGFEAIQAQFMFPGMLPGMMPGYGGYTDSTRPQNQPMPQMPKPSQTDNQDNGSDEDEEVDPEEKKNELEIKKMNLKSQRMKLEQELAYLKSKDPDLLTPEEKEVIRIQTENLKMIALQERSIIEEQQRELEKFKNKKNFPSASVYGHQFFRDGSFRFFQKTDEIAVTDNYVLGTGDQVQLEVWGYRYWSKTYVVSQSGSIDIEGYQKIFVKGLSLQKVREMIGSRLGLGGQESSYSVTVTRPRMVSVNIFGEVFSPGTYTVPATNGAFNVLVSMGGPSDIGSVRNIYIKRDGKIRDSFDLYEYYADVKHQRDVFLQNNDYIIVAPVANLVNIGGAVRRPGRYELKNGETMADLIRFAGGLQPNAFLKDILLKRIRNNEYEVLSLNYDSLLKAKKNFVMTGGESVEIKFIGVDNQFMVQISGAVSVPGHYKVKKGMRISSMIKNANGLTSDAFTERGFLVRTSKNLEKKYISFNPAEALAKPGTSSDLELEDRDTIVIYRLTDLRKFNDVKISGSVRRPFQKQFIAGLKLGEMLFMAGGLNDEADEKSGFIMRTDANFNKRLIPFKPEDVKPGSEWFDFEIMPKDEITVYSKTAFRRNYTLSVTGPVKAGGTFGFSENTRVTDLINLAGGIETNTFKSRAIVVHTDLESGYQSLKTVNLAEVLENPDSKENFILQKNDVLQLFDLSELKNDFMVSIYGPVRRQGEYVYAENMTLQNLIDAAGGLEFITAGTTVEVVRNFFFKEGKYQFLKPQILNTTITSNLSFDDRLVNMQLQPFDKVFIRKNPNFVPLKLIYIDGAINYPGYYALQSENDKLASIIKRAGGYRPNANPKGSRLRRTTAPGDTLDIVLKTPKAMSDRKSRFNHIMKDGDYIYVPYTDNLVYLTGDLNKQSPNDIGAYYLRNKRAKFYIKFFGGGFTNTSDKKKVVVVYQGGRRVATRNYVLFKVYPKVKPGCTIVVNNRMKTEEPYKQRRRFSVDGFLNQTMMRATTVLSVLGIYRLAIGR